MLGNLMHTSRIHHSFFFCCHFLNQKTPPPPSLSHFPPLILSPALPLFVLSHILVIFPPPVPLPIPISWLSCTFLKQPLYCPSLLWFTPSSEFPVFKSIVPGLQPAAQTPCVAGCCQPSAVCVNVPCCSFLPCGAMKNSRVYILLRIVHVTFLISGHFGTTLLVASTRIFE